MIHQDRICPATYEEQQVKRKYHPNFFINCHYDIKIIATDSFKLIMKQVETVCWYLLVYDTLAAQWQTGDTLMANTGNAGLTTLHSTVGHITTRVVDGRTVAVCHYIVMG